MAISIASASSPRSSTDSRRSRRRCPRSAARSPRFDSHSRPAPRRRQRDPGRGRMSDFFQLLVAGLATGAIYALIAIGFTLLWQTSQTINFAQGEFVMLPAFFILAAMNAGAPFWLACLIGIALSIVILGFFF